MSEDESFQCLCQAQIEGTATDEDHAALVALMRRSESARRIYVEQMRVHAMLTWQHGRSQATLAEIPPPANVVRWTPRRWMAIAAALMVFCGLAAWWQLAASRSGASFEVLAATDVSFRVGDQVKRKKIEIERGSLSFRLTSGAVVEVSGPAAVEFISPMHLRLLRGNLTADVGTQAKGFIVDTADARVVDLGTRFGVSANPEKPTDVAVFEGSVEIYKPTGEKNQKPDATLNAGDAIRIDKAQKPVRLKMIALGANANSLGSQSSSDVISAVTDNVADTSFRGYYGLLRGGVGEGARVYTTGHTRTWHPMPGDTFPAELVGADGICTFDVDRKDAGLQITLHVSRACDLYVMTDARAPTPDWIQRDFTDTGYRLRSGPWIPRGTPQNDFAHFYKDPAAYVPCAVWKKRISVASPVVLGSPLAQGKGRIPAMYGLAVKAVR